MALRQVARRARPQSVDRHVGTRLRALRIMLGLTQQQLADLIGVTYQQQHKYEKGINRVSAGRLYHIARALGVEAAYFYEGLETGRGIVQPTRQQLLLELSRHFLNIPVQEHQKAVLALSRALAEGGNGDEQAA
jgi:transcriptional regulator with XRE-family HTH domain